jgi:hypothetical protein
VKPEPAAAKEPTAVEEPAAVRTNSDSGRGEGRVGRGGEPDSGDGSRWRASERATRVLGRGGA